MKRRSSLAGTAAGPLADTISAVVAASPTVKRRRQPFEPLTRTGLLDFVGACSTTTRIGIRSRALVVLLWRAGFKPTEALGLRADDVDLAGGRITLRHERRGRIRAVGLDPQAAAAIRCWLEIRAKLPAVTAESPLMCSGKGTALTGEYVRLLLKKLAKKAKFSRPIHADDLRRSNAVAMQIEGVPVEAISLSLGHGNIEQTLAYLEHVSDETVIEMMRRRAW